MVTMPHLSRYINRYTLLTILAFVSIATVVVHLSSSQDDLQPSAYTQSREQRVITTEDVVNGRYYARGANCSWAPDGDALSWVGGSSGDLVRLGLVGREKRVVVRAEQFVGRPWKVKFSGDGGLVLVGFEPRRLFRSTILARYAVHSAKSGQLLLQLATSPGEDAQQFQLATWSNDNRTILLVHKNDIYALRVGGVGDEGGGKAVRLTWDGSESLFNGVADWVYEEELFTSSPTAVYPSPSGSHVSYLKFNDTSVQTASYNLYGDYANEPLFDEYYQYPKFGTVRYPKSGTGNPTVSVHVVHVGEESCWEGLSSSSSPNAPSCTWEFSLDEMMGGLVGEGSYLIGSLKWVDDGLFVVNVLNRVQNSSWIVECRVAVGCEVVKSNSQVGGWIDNSQLHRHGSEYFTVESVGGVDGLEYGGVVGVSRDVSRVVTIGRYTVDEIVGIYSINSTVLLVFKSCLIGERGDGLVTLDSGQSHYYAVDLGRSGSLPVCLSCYSDCTYSSGKFSSSGEYFVNTCEGEGRVSRVEVVRVTVSKSLVSSSVVMGLEGNGGLERRLAGVELPEVEYFTVPYSVGGRNYSLSCRVVGGRGWKEGGRGSYGLVVDVYGGPNSQKVTRRFTPNDWSYSLASNPHHPTVYLTIDGIGSGRQSNSLAFEVYRDLGNHEVLDKIFAVKWFLKKYPSVDPKRTLIWGWSYGGYLSGMVLGRDVGGVFGCGISVAPVVSWYYYDTIYTERYMSTPEDNPTGYNTSNMLRYADNFRSKDYLLIHGNADDNVHYQQSMVLARGLEQRNILFRMQSYPDENHSLGSVRPHLFATLEDFLFNQCYRRRSTIK